VMPTWASHGAVDSCCSWALGLVERLARTLCLACRTSSKLHWLMLSSHARHPRQLWKQPSRLGQLVMKGFARGPLARWHHALFLRAGKGVSQQ
jgi:hypothetical protein